ncbi:MAG: hypothetical protein RR253_05435, partial [Oscillospiraceae bacterium]
PALVITDAVCRMMEGVLKSEEGYTQESHYNGLLEYAQYTRPYEWHGMTVPDVLLSGHDKNIREYRRQDSLKRTKEKRPDLYKKIFPEEYILCGASYVAVKIPFGEAIYFVRSLPFLQSKSILGKKKSAFDGL